MDLIWKQCLEGYSILTYKSRIFKQYFPFLHLPGTVTEEIDNKEVIIYEGMLSPEDIQDYVDSGRLGI